MTNILEWGKIQTDYLEKEFGRLRTAEVVVTDERVEHIKERHPQDYALFEQYGQQVLGMPDITLRDPKHENTVLMVKRLPETNLNVVVRLALDADAGGRKNSVMTFYRIRDKNLVKLEKKSKVLYKRE